MVIYVFPIWGLAFSTISENHPLVDFKDESAAYLLSLQYVVRFFTRKLKFLPENILLKYLPKQTKT